VLDVKHLFKRGAVRLKQMPVYEPPPPRLPDFKTLLENPRRWWGAEANYSFATLESLPGWSAQSMHRSNNAVMSVMLVAKKKACRTVRK